MEPHIYTDEQLNFIKINIPNMTWKELAQKFNDKYKTNLTKDAIQAKALRSGIQSGRTGHFIKGGIPPNKGKKFPGKTNKTSFKKGQKAPNYRPVGSERIDNDGYVLIKVSDSGPWNQRWRPKHSVIWEEANGPLPKGHCLLFLDGNKQNVTLENLQLITRSQLARLNQNKLISDNAELTKTGIIVADILGMIGERKKRM